MFEEINPFLKFYYKCRRGVTYVWDTPKRIKWFCQRGWRGYADCDTWSFDDYLSRIIPKAVREISERCIGTPVDFLEDHCPDEFKISEHDQNCEGCESKHGDCIAHIEWHNTLIKIAEGFEAYHRVSNTEYEELTLWCGETTTKTIGPDKDGHYEWSSDTTPKGEEHWDTMRKKEEEDWELWKERNPLFIKYFGNLWD